MPNFGAPSLNFPSRWFAKKCSRWDIYPRGEYIHLFIYLLFIYSTYGVSLSESKLCSECRGAGRRKGSPIGLRATPPVTGFRPLSPCWVKQFEVGSLSIRNLGLNRGFDQKTWGIKWFNQEKNCLYSNHQKWWFKMPSPSWNGDFIISNHIRTVAARHPCWVKLGDSTKPKIGDNHPVGEIAPEFFMGQPKIYWYPLAMTNIAIGNGP